ncbi:MAG TPA: NADH-quinone oxidoreductase subunit NuoN [Hyphomicrobiaceae bacterium]|nr:NADH-quinone oxidoreductase subunit NuoN [Hyphomicrobiaceae bacterium]
MTFFAQLGPIYPELLLAVGAMALLMLGVFLRETDGNAEIIGWGAIALLIGAGVLVAGQPSGVYTLFDGAMRFDGFARFVKIIVCIASAATLLLSFNDMREGKYLKFEYPVLVVLATVGMMMMISANDLISLYLGLELQSLALYVMAAFKRDDVQSSEAGLKYFVLGALSSGMLLYGASLVYGFAGSTKFADIATVALQPAAGRNIGLIFGLVFILVGLAFKISAVPFHMWTPDVYQGAPTPVTAFFAAAPKAAAFALLTRVMVGALGGMKPQWQQVIVFISIASMILGAVAAIGQINIKRLLAYSSIANMGFVLVGLAAASAEGIEGVLVYLAIYLVMTLGAFAVVLGLRTEKGGVEEIEDLSGLSQTNPGAALAMALMMFSLAGIPPLAGFWGKYYVFLAAVKAQLWPLAVLGVIASVIGAYYYLRIIKVMYFDEPKVRFRPVARSEGFVMVAASLIVVFGFLPFPARFGSVGDWIMGTAAAAARSLF